jgi:hypothetical protein
MAVLVDRPAARRLVDSYFHQRQPCRTRPAMRSHDVRTAGGAPAPRFRRSSGSQRLAALRSGPASAWREESSQHACLIRDAAAVRSDRSARSGRAASSWSRVCGAASHGQRCGRLRSWRHLDAGRCRNPSPDFRHLKSRPLKPPSAEKNSTVQQNNCRHVCERSENRCFRRSPVG